MPSVHERGYFDPEKEFAFFFNVKDRKTYTGLLLHIVLFLHIPVFFDTLLTFAVLNLLMDFYYSFVRQIEVASFHEWSDTARMVVFTATVGRLTYKGMVNSMEYKQKYPISNAPCFK